MKESFFNLNFDEILVLLQSRGEPAYKAKQIFRWVYQKQKYLPSDWSDLDKGLRDFFSDNYSFELPQIIWQAISEDSTTKFLIKLEDGNTIEAVLIPAPDRMTLCLSSQVGCAIGCRFCHTGTQGLTRNLKPGEIVGQYLVTQKWLEKSGHIPPKITNIVYMGQGEPLHNFQNVKKATQNFLEPEGLGLGQRRITLSTSGLVPQIEKLFDFPPINFAISLHAARNDVRTELMPINKAYDLERLFSAIKKIPLKAHRHITYEYILIRNLNDGLEDIEALLKLIPHKGSKINLIPFNEYPGSQFKRPNREEVDNFAQELNKRGLVTTIRVTKGKDILAACGQLKTSVQKSQEKPN